MRPSRLFPILFTSALLALAPAGHAQGFVNQAALDRADRHASPEWASLAPHLPDPDTGSASSLQVAADVLRARRMPEDALEYYGYALKRGGSEQVLLKRMGITLLDLRVPQQARVLFTRVLSLNKKDSEAWNNLGATEYVLGNLHGSVDDYQRAIKYSKKTAIYHSNLATAYFDLHDYESARHEFERAAAIDPGIYHRAGFGGVEAHVLSSQDRGRFCFELARVAARHGQDQQVIEWLAKSLDSGYDIKTEMGNENTLKPYLADTRVLLLIKNARLMRNGQIAQTEAIPTLAAERVQN